MTKWMNSENIILIFLRLIPTEKQLKMSRSAAIPVPKLIQRLSVRVRSYSIVNQTYHFALDKNGHRVYVPQLTRFRLNQTFQEMKCTGNECVSNLQCRCQNQLFATTKAVVHYLKKQKTRTYEISDIQIFTCCIVFFHI